jgi:hypothetical protein
MSTLLKRRRSWIAATGGIAALTLVAGCGRGSAGGGS